ncbi:hypothetical protein ACFC06_16635 [Nocardia sp. NPDC056064]|uniref:hypothetical protein n=1 Tax=Nocardia sp. NPDC056064 TaxID=3345701 RepID=UPI0035DE87D7
MAVTTAPVLAATLWALWADATAFEDLETLFEASLICAIPVTIWSLLASFGITKYTASLRPTAAVPLLIATTLTLTWLDLPGRIGWQLSRPAMTAAAATCEKTTTTTTIGLYRFHSITPDPDGTCRFRLARDYPIVRTGIVYRPHGEIPSGMIDNTYYVPLDESWYYYHFNE